MTRLRLYVGSECESPKLTVPGRLATKPGRPLAGQLGFGFTEPAVIRSPACEVMAFDAKRGAGQICKNSALIIDFLLESADFFRE